MGWTGKWLGVYPSSPESKVLTNHGFKILKTFESALNLYWLVYLGSPTSRRKVGLLRRSVPQIALKSINFQKTHFKCRCPPATNCSLPVAQMIQSETVPYSSEKQVYFMLLQPGRNPNVLTENKVTSCKVKIAQTASVLHMKAVLSKYIQSTVQAQNTKCFPRESLRSILRSFSPLSIHYSITIAYLALSFC